KTAYTLPHGTAATTINAAITPNLPFEFPHDFAPIALFATLPNILVVHPSLGVRSAKELIDLARAKPDQLSFGSAGTGGLSHVTGELFNVMAGARILHVPHSGTPQTATALLGGRPPGKFSPPPPGLPFLGPRTPPPPPSTRP